MRRLCVAVALGVLVLGQPLRAFSDARTDDFDDAIIDNARQLVDQGRQIFRYDTFGDEEFWGGELHLDQAVAGAQHGGVGPGLSPANALGVGLKVDVDALPRGLRKQLKRGRSDRSPRRPRRAGAVPAWSPDRSDRPDPA